MNSSVVVGAGMEHLSGRNSVATGAQRRSTAYAMDGRSTLGHEWDFDNDAAVFFASLI
jgi:hypothetical protein